MSSNTNTVNTVIPCAGIIVLKDNQTILVRSKLGNYSFPKGKREKGESYFTTATREFEEETGISLDEIAILENIYIDGLSVRGNPNVRYYLATLNRDVEGLTLTFDPEELQDATWYQTNEVFDLEKLLQERKDVFKKALEIFANPDNYRTKDDWKGTFLEK